MHIKPSAKGQSVTVTDVQPPLGAPAGSYNLPGRLTGRRKPGPHKPSGLEVELRMDVNGPIIWLPQHQVPELVGSKADQWKFEEVGADAV